MKIGLEPVRTCASFSNADLRASPLFPFAFLLFEPFELFRLRFSAFSCFWRAFSACVIVTLWWLSTMRSNRMKANHNEWVFVNANVRLQKYRETYHRVLQFFQIVRNKITVFRCFRKQEIKLILLLVPM